MRPDLAIAYGRRLGLPVTASRERPHERALLVGRRWCWTEAQLHHALDERRRALAPARRTSA